MDFGKYREEFPATKKLAWLNHAGAAPLSTRARARIDDWAKAASGLLVYEDPEWARVIRKVRRDAAGMMGCGADEVAFVSTTSEGASLFAQSLDWRVADNVVTASNEFPANVYPWLNLKRRGVHVRMVKPTREGRVLIEGLLSAADSRTRVIAISWVGYNTGYRIDLARLGAECKKRGIHLFVDAIQGLGVFEMKSAEWGVTAAAAETHKWFLGTQGIALFYVSKDVVGGLNPPVVGWRSVKGREDFMTIDFTLSDDATRFEAGCLNTVGIYILSGAMEILGEVGMANVTGRVKELTDYLCEGAAKKGLEVLSPREGKEWSGIVSLRGPGGDGQAAAKVLGRKGVVVTGRADFLRASPHFYNNAEDIDRMLAEL